MPETTTIRRFDLGRIVMTRDALASLTLKDVNTALRRHRACDWGDVDPEDQVENDFSLTRRLRLISVYYAEDATKFWIITEADRSATTILLPEEY